MSEGTQENGLEEIDVAVDETSATDEVKSNDAEVAAAPNLGTATEEFIDDAMDEVELPNTNDFTPNPHVHMGPKDNPVRLAENPAGPNKQLAFLKLGLVELTEIIEKYGLDFDDKKQDESLSKPLLRAKRIIGGLSDALQSAYFRGLDTRDNSDWAQGLENNGELMRAGKARLRADADPILHMRNEMGLGTWVQIPLWHTGIWITLKTPSDGALLELEQRLSMEKITLGRNSNGLVFSSTEVYTKSHVLDFIFDHVVQATIESKDPDVLYTVIKDTDYAQLVWGMALAIYPAGYPLIQPCVANPLTCDHVEEALINISRLSWVDRSKFTRSQVAHMANRTKPMSLDKIDMYQREFDVTAPTAKIEIHPGIALRMRVPSLREARDIGYDWVENILTNTQKAFGMRVSDGSRENYIKQQALLTSLRQYGQWFDAVVRGDDGDETVITDRKQIDDFIVMVSADDKRVGEIYRAVTAYINNSTLSMIALPKYKCPKCQGEPSEEYLKHPKLIPLDVVQVFFTLRDQKVTAKLVAEMTRQI